MKLEISYETTTTKVIEVPKKYQFIFTKDEDDWTDNQWDLNDKWWDDMTRQYGDFAVEREVK